MHSNLDSYAFYWILMHFVYGRGGDFCRWRLASAITDRAT